MRKAHRDLVRNKGPFLALTIMIALGVASFTSIYGAYANLREEVDGTYDSQHFHDALLEIRPTTRASLAALDGVQGIQAWEARLSIEIPVTFDNNEPGVMATVLSLPAMGEPTIDALRYVNGDAPAPGTNGLVLETGFANHHHLQVGDVVHLRTQTRTADTTIAGITLSPEYLWPAKTAQEHMPDTLRRWGAMWMREDALQALAGTPGEVDQITITTTNGANPDDVIHHATQALGAQNVLRSQTRERQASNVVFGLLVNAVSQMAYVLPLLFLSVVGLSTYVVLTRLVHQQRANVGLLRALGYSPRTILWHYLTYAPLLSAVGSIAGFLAGYALSFRITTIFANYVSLASIPVKLRLDLLLIGFLLSLAFAALASGLPALRASRLRPSDAMRPPAPPTGRKSTLERLAPRAPTSVKLGLRNVGRNPRRAAFTILGVALAVSVLVIPQAVIDSLDHVTEVAIVRVQRADEVLIFRAPVTSPQLAEAATTPGVAALEPLLQLPSSFERDGRARDITLVGLAPTSALLQLADADGARLTTSDDGIILSRVFVRDGLRVGDTLPLYGETVRVLGFTQASGTSGFVTLQTAQRWAKTPDASNQAMLKRETGVDKSTMHTALAAALPIAATLDVPQAVQDTKDMMRLYYAMVYIILAFGIAIGAAIVFNTVSINVLEETRDFATLRTLGARTRSLAAQTTTETLALATPGALLGLGLGLLLAQYFVDVFSSDLFVLDMFVRPTALLLAFAGGLLIALLAQLPSLRRVSRLDLAKSTRERAT